MKGSNAFQETIQKYLDALALRDELFAITLKKENKSIEECCNYIIDEVQKSGRNGFADEEIYQTAVHYYDQDTIKSAKNSNIRVVVNHVVELTAEEIQEAKDKAMNELIAQQKAKLTKKPNAVKTTVKEEQSSFDFFS
jgi:hypothetical protein